jgi:hypothetical protein
MQLQVSGTSDQTAYVTVVNADEYNSLLPRRQHQIEHPRRRVCRFDHVGRNAETDHPHLDVTRFDRFCR